jgi:transcriptional regulator with XRE-family HTH domain
MSKILYPMTASLIYQDRMSKGMSRTEYRAAYFPDVSQATFSRYEGGLQQPSVERLLQLGLLGAAIATEN